MNRHDWVRRWAFVLGGLLAFASVAAAFDSPSTSTESGGVSAVWIFANLSFTGMRAQDKGGAFWKVVTFIFGFPGTLLTLILVERGSERAYGIDFPRRSGNASRQAGGGVDQQGAQGPGPL